METSVLLRVSGLRHFLQFLIQFGSSVVVARTLTPEEIGTFSVAMAVIAIATAVRGGSVGLYLVQKRDLQRTHIGSALGLTMAISFTLGAVIALMGDVVADFYDKATIRDILWLTSISFFLAPIQAVAMGLMSRELQLGRHALAGLIASASGAAVTVTLALLGHGPISLAWGLLSNSTVGAILFCALAPKEVWTLPRFFKDWREIWSITSWALLSEVINQFGSRVSELIIGKTLSLADAALIERSSTLPRMLWRHLMPPVLGILVPIVAYEMRNQENLQHLTIRRMRYFGCVFVPILTGMSSQSEHLLLGIYGGQWTAAVEPAAWMCLSAAITGQFVVISPIMSALGKTRDAFFLTIASLVVRLMVLSVTATISILAVAMGSMVGATVSSMLTVYFGNRLGIIRYESLVTATKPGIVAGIVIYLVGIGLDYGLTTYTSLGHLPILLIVICVLGVTLLGLLRFLEPDLIRYGRKVLGWN